MPLLDRSGAKADPWTRTADASTAMMAIVPHEALGKALRQRRRGQKIGIDVQNNANSDDLLPVLAELALISVDFPAFSDGRGFSLARRIRRAGYTGILRARGPVIADQMAYALACGFDEIEVPETTAKRQPTAQWLEAAQAHEAGYQRGYARGPSILDRRRAGREAEG